MKNTLKGILTVAIGKKYVKQAIYLSKSCMLNSPHTIRAVITNLPDMLSDFYDIIIPFTANDDPFSVKTRLYEFTPFEKTLFIDADSLVFHPVDEYWNFSDMNCYVYYGNKLTKGEWYIDIQKTCQLLQIQWIPQFNTGMILFDKSEESRQIFETAFYYFKNFKKEGIEMPLFKGNHYSDEPFLAIAVAKQNIEPVNDYGRFSRTLIKTKQIRLNIRKRIARFIKDEKMVHPLVVHFCGRRGNFYYFFEKIRLLLL